jgi:cellulose synthase/poly-beta-1,6-N-acetylglucosamine synthase-like glycosyltransferase
MKKSLISIGILAHNEERNIEGVIKGVLAQEQTTWKLKTIYVACDGCTDNTVAIVRNIKHPSITLLLSKKRLGKAANEQKIFNTFQDDILVMFDADIQIADRQVINRLIQPLLDNEDIKETGGNARPFPPTSFFEKAVYTTFTVLDLSRNLRGGDTIYGASGQCIAMKKELVKQIKFPKNIFAEDDFIYFTNKQNGGKFQYVPTAQVYYKLPKTLGDYFRQTLRSDTVAATKNIEMYFKNNLVRKDYYRPPTFYIRAVIQVLKTNPIGTLFMVGIRLFTRICLLYTSKHYQLNWFTAKTTK